MLLARSSLRFFARHPGQLALALIGIAAGVAVMTGVLLIRHVLLDGLDEARAELAGPDSLRIVSTTGAISPEQFARLALTDGAPELVPVLRQRVRIGDRRLELVGIDPLTLATGSRFQLSGFEAGQLLGGTNRVALNATTLSRLGAGQDETVDLTVGQRTLAVELALVLDGNRGLDDRLLMDLASAQHLLGGKAEITLIEAPAQAGEWLARHLPSELVLQGAEIRREEARRLTAGMRANLSAMGLLALAVGLFVIFGVLNFLLVQRRRSFAIIRAIGVTPAQLDRQLSLEAMALAGLGGLAGLVIGTWLADRLLDLVRRPLLEVYQALPVAGVEPSVALYLGVLVLTLAAAALATAPVLIEARQIPPGQLVRSDRRPALQRRWVILLISAGLTLSGALVLVGSDGLPAALVGLFLVLAGLVVLVPSIAFGIIKLGSNIGQPELFSRALGLVQGGRRRLAPAIAALTLALALGAGIGMMVMGFRVAVDDWIDRLLRASVYLTVDAGVIDQRVVDAVASSAKVVAISSARRIELADGHILVAYDLPEPAWGGFDWVAGDQPLAREAFIAGTGVLITEPLARHRQLDLGQTIKLSTPAGAQSFAIAGIFRDYSSEQGFVAINGPTYRQIWDDPVRDSLGLYPATDVSLADLHRSIAAIEGLAGRERLTTREEIRSETLAVFDRTFRITTALAVLVGLIAAVCLLSALLAMVLERQRDYATLRALGLPAHRLFMLVLVQTGALALTALLLATPLATLIHGLLSLTVQPRAFGWSVPVVWAWQPVLALVPVVIVVALVAGLAPARRLALTPPSRLLRGDR